MWLAPAAVRRVLAVSGGAGRVLSPILRGRSAPRTSRDGTAMRSGCPGPDGAQSCPPQSSSSVRPSSSSTREGACGPPMHLIMRGARASRSRRAVQAGGVQSWGVSSELQFQKARADREAAGGQWRWWRRVSVFGSVEPTGARWK
jgi:hypothetical protein